MSSRRNFIKLLSSIPFAEPLFGSAQVAGVPGQMPPDQMAGSPVGDPLPGQSWKVHDRIRPQARKVTPGMPLPTPGPASDAVVLFDGKDLSQWQSIGRDRKVTEPKWKIENGYMKMVPRSGSLITKRRVW